MDRDTPLVVVFFQSDAGNQPCRDFILTLSDGIGQNFDDFMKEQGLYEEVKDIASKRIVALQLEEEMKKQKITKTLMAKKMHTSRSSIDNILNFTHNTTIGVLEQFAEVLGKKIQIAVV